MSEQINQTPSNNPQPQPAPQPAPTPQPQSNGGNGGFSFDYEKLAQIITGRTSSAEDAALKGYFKQQGLSQQEVESAIAQYKQQKAANTPDVGAMQTKLNAAQHQLTAAKVENSATMIAMELGLQPKTVPYVLKMADLTKTVKDDGTIDEEAVKNAINKVLEDVPALKPSNTGSNGFIQVGANGEGNHTNNEDALKKAFGL
jgi:hypothetical protein